jgi:glycosyltransferase involved in cell wall biosynthesis
MRYVWDLEDQYFPTGRFPWPVSWYVRSTCARLRAWDAATANRPHVMIANSAHVARRITRHYRRQAVVVHPPVDVARFAAAGSATHGDDPPAYLLAGALAPYKRGDLAIEACRRLERPLTVIGSGQEGARLRRVAGPGVTFRGWAEGDELPRAFAGARALLFPGEEDFGIIPVEAMASGCPAIAYGRGGALETVGRGADASTLARVAAGGEAIVPGGVLFGEASVEGLMRAIRLREEHTFDPELLRAQAAPFSVARFDREFREAFDVAYDRWKSGVIAA